MRGDLGVRGRTAAVSRLAVAIAFTLLALSGLWAASALAAGDASGGSASVVVHQVNSVDHPRAFWTPARIRQAKPLPPLSAPDRAAGAQIGQQAGGRPSFIPASPRGSSDATLESGPVPTAAADPTARGTDTGDSTVFPNSANGFVLFFYGPNEYQCSGSVINSSAGDVVLTAGHCVIDPGPGTHATNIVFIPGYRDGAEPFGVWPVTSFATTPEWESTTSTGDPNDSNEAGDMALLTLANRPSDGATVQSVVGAFGIGFNQARHQTYMEYGYPADTPYNGDRLYELTTPWAVDDSTFSPPTMGISSDFTSGSSGGPWLVGSPPVALSVNDYTYLFPISLRGYMFGPYFGSIAEQLYRTVAPAPSPAAVPSNRFRIGTLSRNRRRGTAVLQVSVPGPGVLKLSGHGLLNVTKHPGDAGSVALPVRTRGSTSDILRANHKVRVRAKIAFTPTGGQRTVKFRDVVLLRHG
jgi:V8-like Glu-specific endopeptidase